jgi:RNA polymerase sigma-70 factor (ECF subfamily)
MQLRDIEGLRYDEIAGITGLTESQVKVYLHRARKKIRETL